MRRGATYGKELVGRADVSIVASFWDVHFVPLPLSGVFLLLPLAGVFLPLPPAGVSLLSSLAGMLPPLSSVGVIPLPPLSAVFPHERHQAKSVQKQR
jgi:hypothetical protein